MAAAKRKPLPKRHRYALGGDVMSVNMDQPEIDPGPRPEIYQQSSNESNLITSGITMGLKMAGLGGLGGSSSSKRKGGKVTKVIKPKLKGKRR